jgi:pectate lyase
MSARRTFFRFDAYCPSLSAWLNKFTSKEESTACNAVHTGFGISSGPSAFHSRVYLFGTEGNPFVTYANNYFSNVSSRLPSIRFGTGHIFNNYYENVLSSAVDTRDGAQVLVESNVFVKAKKPVASLYSDDQGYAVVKDNDFGGEKNEAPAGTLTKVPYTYTALGSAKVKAAVVGTAGNTLKF